MTELADQAQYYTSKWNRFEGANEIDLARMVKIGAYISTLHLRQPFICDLGCGAGWGTAALAEFGPAFGVDLSDVSEAQRRYPNCKFESADILQWPCPPAQFDVVVSQEVLEHIEYHRKMAYLKTAMHILKPGGYLIVTTPNKRIMKAMPNGGRDWSHQPIEDWVDSDLLYEYLHRSRFQILDISSIILGMGGNLGCRIVNSAKIHAALSAIGALDAWKRVAERRCYGLHLVALARKPSA